MQKQYDAVVKELANDKTGAELDSIKADWNHLAKTAAILLLTNVCVSTLYAALRSVPSGITELSEEELEQVSGGYTLFSIKGREVTPTDLFHYFGGDLFVPGGGITIKQIEDNLDGADSATKMQDFAIEAIRCAVTMGGAALGGMCGGAGEVAGSAIGAVWDFVSGWF